MAASQGSAMLWVVVALALAEITLSRHAVLWLGGPFVLSLAVLFAGLLVRTRSPRVGLPLVVIGVGGPILSAGWVAFAFWVDAVLATPDHDGTLAEGGGGLGRRGVHGREVSIQFISYFVL
jgi:hypothetical protein